MKPNLSGFFKKVDLLLISSPSNIKYLTGYSGFSENERECLLLISKKKKYLITDKRYAEAVKKTCTDYKIVDEGVGKFLVDEKFLGKFKHRKVGFEENNLNVWEYKKLRRFLTLIPINLLNIRAVKGNEEILRIKKACNLGDRALKYAVSKLKAGITEKELAEKIVIFFRENKADFAFSPIIAFGQNSAIPHHLPGKTKLKKNNIVLIDIGTRVDNYCSDMTRTYFFGKPSSSWIKIYEKVIEAQGKAQLLAKPGIKTSKIDIKARNIIKAAKYPDIIHSVGHGIGLAVHESPSLSPNSKDILKEGMVFSIEPGIYLNGRGGIRIEDLFIVTKKGVEKLTHSPTFFILQ